MPPFLITYCSKSTWLECVGEDTLVEIQEGKIIWKDILYEKYNSLNTRKEKTAYVNFLHIVILLYQVLYFFL